MPDLNIALAAIQSHTTALEGAMNRHGANAGRCKVWSGAMVAGMLLLAAGRAQMAALPWAAGVVVLLAVADAGQVAMARVFTDAYNRFMQKLPLNGGNAMNPSTNAQGNRAEEFVLPAPVLGWRQAGQVLAALGSFSVWPFYGALLALLVGFHLQTAARGGDGERGRVGESARLLPSSATNSAKPFSGSVKAAVPMNVVPAASNRPSPSGNGAPQTGKPMSQSPIRPGQFPIQPVRPVTATPPPGQALPYSPIPASAVQPASSMLPGGRNSAVPSPRLPQDGVPPLNRAPQTPNAGGTPALQRAPAGAVPGAAPAAVQAPPASVPVPEGKPVSQP